MFRIWLPARYGGFEIAVLDGLRLLEELAYWEASAAWCAMIGATTSTLAAFLPEEHAAPIYADPRTITGGVAAPIGVARPEGAALRVSGAWPWGSGTEHCAWIVAGCRVETTGAEPGVAPRIVFLESSQVRFLDTWNAFGLCGTGSTDFAVDDALVPAGRWVSFGESAPSCSGALYRFPRFGLLALGISAVCLGLARRAVAELVELARSKSYAGSRRTLAERPAVQHQTAEAEAGIAAAWALVERAVAGAESAVAGDPIDLIPAATKAGLRQAATFAAEQSKRAVDAMYHAAGGTAVYRQSPLQRVFRDLHVAIQHQMVAPRTWELLGRLRLGLPTDTSQL